MGRGFLLWPFMEIPHGNGPTIGCMKWYFVFTVEGAFMYHRVSLDSKYFSSENRLDEG